MMPANITNYIKHVIMTSLCLWTSCCLATNYTLRSVGDITISLPGFLSPFWFGDALNASLLVSTFTAVPLLSDSSFGVWYLGQYLDNLTVVQPSLIYDGFQWPREPSQTPTEVFGFPTVTQADGFLVPGNIRGSIYVTDVRDVTSPVTYDLVQPGLSTPYFYARVLWKDLNGDGRQDALTCRVNYQGDVPVTQMVWLEHPRILPLGNQWTVWPLGDDVCDTFFTMTSLTVPGGRMYDALFTVGYFTQVLAVYWTNNPDGLWSDPLDIDYRVIDTGHKFIEVQTGDMNLDGTLDLVVSINSETNGSLEIYEIPNDFRIEEYVKHTIESGFRPRNNATNGGSPGIVRLFHPHASDVGKLKPWIVLAGDDAGQGYYFTPTSEDTLSWTYDKVTFIDSGVTSIIGAVQPMDVDADGFQEILVSDYYNNAIHVFTFKP